jgi:hypothetical protein
MIFQDIEYNIIVEIHQVDYLVVLAVLFNLTNLLIRICEKFCGFANILIFAL